MAGKNYFRELALELEKFLLPVLTNKGGILALVDIYCMYNRARGNDLISPEDLLVACEKMNQTSEKILMKSVGSGVKAVQLKHFSEDSYYKKLSEILEKQPGMTADKMANELNVNVVLIKE